MGLNLSGKSIFVNTAPIIYFIEEKPIFLDKLFRLFSAAEKGELFINTSIITFLEVLVLPIRLKQNDLADQYEKILFNSSGINVIDIDRRIAKKSAYIRSVYGLKTPDAIQIATAIENDADIFLTNDAEFKKINEIEILFLSQDF